MCWVWSSSPLQVLGSDGASFDRSFSPIELLLDVDCMTLGDVSAPTPLMGPALGGMFHPARCTKVDQLGLFELLVGPGIVGPIVHSFVNHLAVDRFSDIESGGSLHGVSSARSWVPSR